MAENIIVVNFDVESEAYQALSEIRRTSISPEYVVSQAIIIKKEAGRIIPQDRFDTGIETADDTRRGGLVGSLVGILGGPIGVLLGGSMGVLIGSTVDTVDTAQNVSLIEKVCESIPDDKTSLIALVSEIEYGSIGKKFDKFSVQITCLDAAEVAAEIEKAEELQREMEKEARKKLREEKKDARKQKVEDHRAKIKADFESLKNKFSRKD